jgi:hypothetical protein
MGLTTLAVATARPSNCTAPGTALLELHCTDDAQRSAAQPLPAPVRPVGPALEALRRQQQPAAAAGCCWLLMTTRGSIVLPLPAVTTDCWLRRLPHAMPCQLAPAEARSAQQPPPSALQLLVPAAARRLLFLGPSTSALAASAPAQ